MTPIAASASLAALVSLVITAGLAVTAEQSNRPTVGVVPTGYQGRSTAEWAGDLYPIDTSECGVAGDSAVFFLSDGPGDCVNPEGHHIFLAIVAKECATDERLKRRTERAEGKRAEALWFRVNAQESFAFRCLHEYLDLLDGPFLAVDGVEILIDKSHFALSPPLVPDGVRTWHAGYFAMLGPLSVGSHTIVTGHSAFEDQPLRVVTEIEVIPDDALETAGVAR